VPRGTSQSASYKGHGMIFIVTALFLVTLYFIGPKGTLRNLSLRETGVLFIIYLCVGLVIRTILFIFGM
jgi:hypothetical protein